MKIAMFVESPPDAGGGFQQSLSTVHALLGMREHEFVVFTPLQSAQRRLRDFGIESIVYRSAGVRLLDRLSATVTGGAIFRRLRRLGFPRLGRHLDALLDDHAIDLVVMTNCAEAALRIADHHYLATLWDMDHRDRLE